MRPFRTATISAPGFLGLNTQEPSIDLDSGFSLRAVNCVIDRFGRIGARKGFTLTNPVNLQLGTNPIEFLFEVVTPTRDSVIISGGNNQLFQGRNQLVTETIPNYTITGNNWKAATLAVGEGVAGITRAYLVQKNHRPLVFGDFGGGPNALQFEPLGDESVPQDYHAIPEQFQPDTVAAAFGRIWYANIPGNPLTAYFSELLQGDNLKGGDAGSLNLSTVMPSNEEIVAIVPFNGFLLFFGKNNIAVYSGAEDPTQLQLVDFIPAIGCVSAKTIAQAGNDLMFLSATGLRSFNRVVQEKSLPMREVSNQIRDDLLELLSIANFDTIHSVYSQEESIYLLTFPDTRSVFCFDLRSPLQNGTYRVTTWSSLLPFSSLRTAAGDLLLGVPEGIGLYGGFTDNGSSYRLQYYSSHLPLQDPSTTKNLKRIQFTLVGGSQSQVTVQWAFDYSDDFSIESTVLESGATRNLYNNTLDDEIPGRSLYGEATYSSSTTLDRLSINAGGQGNVVQVGLEADIEGQPLSIQRIDIGFKQGKVSING